METIADAYAFQVKDGILLQLPYPNIVNLLLLESQQFYCATNRLQIINMSFSVFLDFSSSDVETTFGWAVTENPSSVRYWTKKFYDPSQIFFIDSGKSFKHPNEHYHLEGEHNFYDAKGFNELLKCSLSEAWEKLRSLKESRVYALPNEFNLSEPKKWHHMPFCPVNKPVWFRIEKDSLPRIGILSLVNPIQKSENAKYNSSPHILLSQSFLAFYKKQNEISESLEEILKTMPDLEILKVEEQFSWFEIGLP